MNSASATAIAVIMVTASMERVIVSVITPGNNAKQKYAKTNAAAMATA